MTQKLKSLKDLVSQKEETLKMVKNDMKERTYQGRSHSVFNENINSTYDANQLDQFIKMENEFNSQCSGIGFNRQAFLKYLETNRNTGSQYTTVKHFNANAPLNQH
jgi:hypothetical protein